MEQQRSPLRITRGGLIGTVIVLLVAGICVRLGIWQLHRLRERRAYNQLVAARMQTAPVDLFAPPTDTTGLPYRPARAAGSWDPAHAIVLAGRSFRETPGVYLLVPLRFAGGGLLVNLGWLPAEDAAAVDPARFAPPESARVAGLLLPLPAGRPLPVAADTFRRVWYRIEATSLRHSFPYPLPDLYLQQLPEPGAPVVPHRLPPPALDEGPHLSYAIQWFSFAAIGLIGWASIMLRPDREEKQEGPRRGPPHPTSEAT